MNELYRYDAWTSIVVDFLVYVVSFCGEAGFSAAKTRAAFSIAARTFAHAFGDTTKSRDETYDHFKALVLAQSRLDEGPFDIEDVEPLADFACSTFFTHFSTYEACFLNTQPLEPFHRPLLVETPLQPPALASASIIPPPPLLEEETKDEQQQGAPPPSSEAPGLLLSVAD